MGIFGPPNVEKLKAKKDTKGLIKALGYEKDSGVRMAAAKALEELSWKPDLAALKEALKKGHDEIANLLIKKGAVIDIETRNDFRVATMILLGLDPWWHKDTQERFDLVQRARKLIKPEGEKLTEVLIQVLRQDGQAENRAQAAIILGILNADFKLFEARGLIDRTLLAYKRKLPGQVIERPLCLNDFRLLHNDPIHGGNPDHRVIEALRQALDDEGSITLDPGWELKSYPCLDIHIILLASSSQLRTITGERRKGEAKDPFYLSWYKGVEYTAALSLVLIGDKESMRHIVELGGGIENVRRIIEGDPAIFAGTIGQSYVRAGFFQLADDLGLI